jgi:hypothetical protein
MIPSLFGSAEYFTNSTPIFCFPHNMFQLVTVGPTSFAPLIYAAMSVVESSNWQYHVLVIIADGQVMC